jgi:hypothetical protein
MPTEKNIVFKATPKQEAFIEAVFSGKYTVLVFGGAIRGGKTFVALALALLLGKIFPRSRWTIVRKDLKRLKDNTRPSLNKFIEGSKIKINETAQTFTMSNGSTLIFKGENYEKDKTLESFKGHETNGFIIEEGSEIREETFNKCIERAGSYIIVPEPKAGQPPPIIVITCNPTQGWLKKKVYDLWKKDELPDHMFYLPSYVTDNPYLPKAYTENLKNLPLWEYEVFVKGNWDVVLKVKNAFWYQFDVEQHVKPVFYDDTTTIHVSIDSNVMPYCSASLWQVFPGKKKAVQIHEIAAEDPYNHASGLGSQVVDYLMNIEYSDTVYIYGDATTKNQNTIDEKRRSFYEIFVEELSEQFNVVDYVSSSNPSVSKTGEFVNAIYSGFAGWKMLVHEGCKYSLSDYVSVRKDMDGTMLKKKVQDEDGNKYEEFGHLSDTKRYFLYKCLEEVYHEWDNRFSDPPEAIPIDPGPEMF